MRNVILLVEDDPRDLELILMALEGTTLAPTVDVVRDGIECLDYLHARADYVGREPGNPALIILDHTLPKLDGIEVLSEIRRFDALKRIPVVLLASSIKESALSQAYELGANSCVVKPVSFKDFRRVIGEILRFWTQLNRLPGGG